MTTQKPKANTPKKEEAPSTEITDGSGLDASLNDDAAMEEMATQEAALAERKKKLEEETKEVEAREKALADREAKLSQGIVNVDVGVSAEEGVEIDTTMSVVDRLTANTKPAESVDPKKCPKGMVTMKCSDSRRIPTLGGHVFRFYADTNIYVPEQHVNHCKKYGAVVVG